MSSGSISDPGEVGEGEGPKVVQSSFKEASIMNKSVAVKDPPPVVEEIKQETIPEAADAVKDNKENKKNAPKKGLKNGKQKFYDNFNFEMHRLTQSSTATHSGKIQTSPKNYIQRNIMNSKLLSNSKSNKEFAPAEIPEIIKKRQKFNVQERFYKKADLTKDKIKAWKDQKEQDETVGCTFKPQIKTKREKKTNEEFYEYMKAYIQKKENKIKSMKDEEKKANNKSMEFTHQPKLCEKSIQMIARKSDLEESTFDRLHRLYKSASGKSSNNSGRESVATDFKNDDSVLFHPTVNKKSQLLNRSEPVEKILYDDALRRINKDKNPPNPAKTKFITNKSEKVLIEKLKRDFEEAFMCINTDTTLEINYTKMIELFKCMYFIKDEHKKEDERLLLLESWKILSIEGENYCKKPSILVFLIAIMGFYEDWMGVSEGNRLVMTSFEANKIHIKFDLFCANRISVINKSTVNKSYKTKYEYSFHPQTVMESETLAKNWRSQHREGGKIEDMLIAEKAKTEKKLEEKRQIMEEQALDECSFQPIIEQMPEEWRVYGVYEKEDLTAEYFKMINDPKFQNVHKGVLLHDLAKIMQQRREAQSSDVQKIRDEKEVENCTFSPKLEERIYPKDYEPPEPKQKSIMSPNIKRLEGNRGTGKSSMEKFASEDKIKAYNDLKNMSDEPVKKAKWPLLESNNGEIAVFSVVLPKSTEKLVFNIVNDDPAFKVMEFSKAHGLKKEEEYRLVKELTLLKT